MSYPLLYEINTRCWLRGLSERSGKLITLATVPDVEFSLWRKLGFTHIWLMGVWTTGPRSRSVALNDPQLRAGLDHLLPGWSEGDVPGSPYAIGEYEVPEALGGEIGLKAFRQKLNAAGLKLLLDFVPNHLGLDHPWLTEKPDLFVQGRPESPGTFLQPTLLGPRWIAHGRDPYFSPWTDTAQLDYRRGVTRAAMIEVLQSVARLCDGVRCDMAMLELNEVFAKTWAAFPISDPPLTTEFWADAISSVKKTSPDFLLVAEAYWGSQSQLQSLGFDYTYDKQVLDCLLDRRYADLQDKLLGASPADNAACARFLENHDERRIASVLSPAEHRAAAMLLLGLPGLRLLYEGQLSGWKTRVPVQLGPWPNEEDDAEIQAMYERLLVALNSSAVGKGDWKLLRPQGWPDNSSAQNMIIVQWQTVREQFDLVVVNLAAHASQCIVPLAVEELAAHHWQMRDLIGNEIYERAGAGLHARGLFLELPANGAALFHFNQTG